MNLKKIKNDKMLVIKNIKKLKSFKYFIDIFGERKSFYEYKSRFLKNINENGIVENLKQIVNDCESNNLIKNIQLDIHGYILKIDFIFSNIKENKYLNEYINIVHLYNLNENKLKDLKENNIDNKELSGIRVSIKTFSSVKYEPNSQELKPVFTKNQNTHILYITKDISFYLINKKRIPLTIKWLCNYLNYLSKKDRNKLLNLIFDIFYNKCYLIKDIKQYISKHNIFFIPISFNELFKYHNYNEFFSKNFKETYNLNFNKNDINFNYILFNIYKYIDEDDIQKFIYDFKLDFNNNKNKYLKLKLNFTKKYDVLFKIINNLYFYGKIYYNINDDWLYDYIMLCKNNKSKIKIKNIGYNNIKELHDNEMEKLLKAKKNTSKYKFDYKNSKFKELIKNMPSKYILINDEYSLWKESQEQHNCVYTYKNKIKNDKCIIYKYLKNINTHYTIELRKIRNNYVLIQMQNTFNNKPIVDDYNEVKNDIDNINKLIKKKKT